MIENPPSIVIGAGIVGLCTALYLQETGRAVILVDHLPPGEGTSSGNAGIISAGSVHPEAMPGIWKEIPHMLLQRLAPISVQPRYLPRLLPWFMRFLASSSETRADASSTAIHALASRALEYLQPLVNKAGAAHLLRQSGVIYVHETPAQFAKAQLDCAYFERRGVSFKLLDGVALAKHEPALRPGLAGGVLVPSAAQTLSPLALSKQLFALFLAQGGQYRQEQVTGFVTGGERLSAVRTAEVIACSEVFITAGAYSGLLSRQLGSAVPLDTERGYHLHCPTPGIELARPLLFGGRAFAATSMQDGLRLAGTVEFAGLTAPATPGRAQALGDQARYLFPGLNTDQGKPWLGFRPSMPDTIPVISRSPHYTNVFFGFGHGHLGLTQSAVTGALLALMAEGKQAPFDITPYRIDRFTKSYSQPARD
jgi:D-amino-acid dehydrogenase